MATTRTAPVPAKSTIKPVPEGDTALAPREPAKDDTASDSETLDGMRRVMGSLAPMIASFGAFMTAVGELEVRVKTPMPKFFEKSFSKEAVTIFVTKAPPELVGQFFKVTLGFAAMGNLDLNLLTAEEKIAKGRSLNELASEVSALIAKLDELTGASQGGK